MEVGSELSWGELYERKQELKQVVDSLFADYSESWGAVYDDAAHFALHGEEFYNMCHGPGGLFCQGADGPGRVRDNAKKPGRDPVTGVARKSSGGAKRVGPGSRMAGERRKEKGGYHPAGDYAYAPDAGHSSSWKLRLTGKPGGKPDAVHTAAAAQALSPAGYRGQRVVIPAKHRAAVIAKVRSAWLVAHKGKTEADLPASLRKS